MIWPPKSAEAGLVKYSRLVRKSRLLRSLEYP
jgi:hypothetical protein